MARSDTRKATSTRKKRNVAKTLKDLMKKPEYKITRERKGPRGNTITDYTVDGKPMTRRRVTGVGVMDSPRKMADKPLGPPKKPTGLNAVTKKQSPTDVMKASGRGKEGVAFPKTKDTTSKKGMSEFGKAFAAARKAGKKQFMFKGEPYHTRTKEEEAARKAKSTSKMYGGKMVKKKEGGSTGSKSKNEPSEMVKKKIDSFYSGMVKKKSMSTRKAKPLAEGSSVGSKSKSSKPKSSKPKGVGCATSGYGKALGGR